MLAALFSAVVLLVTSQAAMADSAAETAVKEAKKYAGTTLHLTWEAGIQALDPVLFSGPLWEELTGIKIKVIELWPPEEQFKTMVQEHDAGSGAYDVLQFAPAWMADLVNAGVL